MNHTIDVQENNAESVNDTVSVGGTRYMVKIKGGVPKFYGDASDSHSQYNKQQMEYTNDNNSRIDYENVSANQSIGGGSALSNPQRALEILSNAGGKGDASPFAG